jgi:hypothetical protein
MRTCVAVQQLGVCSAIGIPAPASGGDPVARPRRCRVRSRVGTGSPVLEIDRGDGAGFVPNPKVDWCWGFSGLPTACADIEQCSAQAAA